ncbi:MAG: GNAT family N-acetyltransferase [Anaerolineae bacterium]|nr:GNAT family N-acetyltransferase [Anaerolineae bacterium]
MSKVTTRTASGDDFPTVARLIIEQNQKPERQCIHSGDRYENTLQTMISYTEAAEFCLALAEQAGEIVGIFGCEYDETMGRGWLWGPFFLIEPEAAWQNALNQALLNLLPASVRRIDSFLSGANRQGQEFYVERGFDQAGMNHVYTAKTAPDIDADTRLGVLFETSYTEAVIRLHETAFPNTYERGAGMLDKIDDNHQVFVYAIERDVLGYVYATINDDGAAGYIDFLAVREDARGRGIGRALLLTALKWCFTTKGMPEVSLTVRDENATARSLYERVGFRLQYVGVNHRKVW